MRYDVYNKDGYPINILDSLRIDRSAVKVTSLFDESDERDYWLAKTPYEVWKQ